jgi:lipopolysaccharide transport system ATP-binding protein
VIAAVEIDHLWEAYRPRTRRGWLRHGDPRWAIRDLSVTVAPGELVGVVGRNGAGKSTLLQCIAGVLHPTRGRVVTHGRVASLVDLAAGFHAELTGRENAWIAGVLSGMSRAEARDRDDEIADFAGLDEATMNAPLLTYSAGMALRLGFAITVSTRPSVLVVDEVLAVGDTAFQRKCVDTVRELRERGCAVVFVSHNLDLMASQADRVAVIDEGRLVHLGDAGSATKFYLELTGGRPDAPDLSLRSVYGINRRAKRRRLRRGV